MTRSVLRVLVVADASAFAGIRRGLWPQMIEVVAASGRSALRLLQQTQPDVVLLDFALTNTDALQLLARLAAASAAPVLALVSGSVMAEGARAAGASEVVECATPDEATLHTLSSRIVALAGRASMRPSQRISETRSSLRGDMRPPSKPSSLPFKPSLPAALRRPMSIIGASTGGTLALPELLRALPANAPPVLVVQHMLPEFTSDYAERLNAVCALRVHEAVDGELLKPGHVLIAPGGRHLRIQRDGQRFLRAVVSADAPVGKHRPSIDVLFEACAEVLGGAAIGVLLTGMGDDGARGLLALRNAGARTIVQDQASSACFGMPSAAIQCGAAKEVLSLSDIARTLAELYAS